jgi:hypothetical protein
MDGQNKYILETKINRYPGTTEEALGFFDQSLSAIAPTWSENYFDLDVRFAEFYPPDNQDEFRRYIL